MHLSISVVCECINNILLQIFPMRAFWLLRTGIGLTKWWRGEEGLHFLRISMWLIALKWVFHNVGMVMLWFCKIITLSSHLQSWLLAWISTIIYPFTCAGATSQATRRTRLYWILPHIQLSVLHPLFLWELHKCPHDAAQCLWEPETWGLLHRDHHRCKWACVSLSNSTSNQ